ncbi:PglZ domain-containing protein [Bradyrhizobium yuanmingense]|uniref:PglZ domain-containing protein n=1 Tax=Bradyrhizobium yuanmingense TaxID=108015 RepID=UPI0004B9F5CB|nr:PglZ domain-containing protein [Bradyrhizobium yuanmingense]
MHPLHDYIANQISDRIKDRRVVVMYDKREELRPFFAEIADGRSASAGPVAVNFGKRKASLYVFDGSFLKARFAVEDMTSGDQPDNVVVYIPGLDRDAKGSLLMELEKAGTFYQQPALKQFARLVLRKRFTDIAIDEMLKSDALTYTDLAGMAQDDGGGSQGASLLKSVFGTTDTVAIITDWLGDTSYDADIQTKAAVGELRDAALAKMGLALPADATLGRARQIALRYVLVNEFRSDLGPNADLQGQVATVIKNVPEAKTSDHHKAVREVAKRLRERHSTAYVEGADKIEAELGLSREAVNGTALGSIDTFRFEEAAVVAACFDLIASEKFEQASALMGARESSFWVSRELSRKSVWAVCKLMVDLGLVSSAVDAMIAKANGNPTTWVDRYVSEKDGWYALDQAQRRLEAFLSSLDEEVDEKAKAKIRDLYENTVRRMSEGFLKALQKADWTVSGVLQQTRIWSDVVASRPVPVAYVMVDAMRFEMGHELIGRLTTRASEVQMRPALAALPSITPVGMAALLPGASATFSVVSNKDRLGASIDGTFLPDLSARQKFLKSRIPDLIDLTLDDVISMSTKALQKKVGNSKVIIIRSTEIDAAGENATTTTYARRVMDNVVEDLARCLGRLATIGIGEAVVTADHGHLFFAADRDPSMRLDTPGGDAIDLHRRCWVGRGGATPAGSVRVPGAKLGYPTDLDFAFPASTSVFKSGGDLAYHHGGTSLQEMVIPVIAVKLKVDGSAKAEKDAVVLTHDFDAVTNRIFTVHIELGAASKDLFAGARKVRPIVVSDDRPVARAAIATGADLAEGVLTLPPAVKANVGFMLTDDTVKHVRIQVLDAETDAILYVSKKDIPVRLGV